jgi:aminoglycoside phosphotransferase (APT) family kinase protein
MVLRLYAAGTDPVQPRLEQAVQDGLADAHFPAPRVILADSDPDRLGSMFVVMERLRGRGFLRGVRPDQFVPDFPKTLPAMANGSFGSRRTTSPGRSRAGTCRSSEEWDP